MVDVTFDHIQFLWLLFAVPIMIVLHFFLMKFTRRRAVIFANFEALRRVTGGMVLSKNITLLVVRVVIVILLILASSGLTVWMKASSSTFNYVIVVDASASMLATDFEPNRLEVAKETAKSFIDSVVSDVKIGVVSFSGVPRVETSLTNSKEEAKLAIDKIKISATGGTDITAAIISAVNILEGDGDRAKAVILLTDGRHTVGGPLSEAIKYAREKEVTVSTIGMATEKGAQYEMSSLLSTIDEESLIKIASNTGGQYFKAGDQAALQQSFLTIIEETEQNLPHPLMPWLLGAGLILLLLEWGLISTRFRILP